MMTQAYTVALVLLAAATLFPSEARAQFTPCANPDPPAGLAATVVAGRVRLTWTAPPPVNEFCFVAGYTVGIGFAAGTANASELDTTLTQMDLSFTRGQFYARVQSVLSNGQRGAYSADVQIIIPEPEPACLDRPIAVSNVSAASVGAGTTITWVAPTTGCPALGYLVLIGSSPGAQDRAKITTTSTSAFVEASVGISHAVVVPFNQEGVGPASASATLNISPRAPNPPPPPAPECSPGRIPPPRNLRATVIGVFFELFWDAPERECPTTGYTLRLATSGNVSQNIPLPPGARSFNGTLPRFDPVTASVVNVTDGGSSDPSNVVTLQAEPFHDCVGLLTVSQLGTIVHFAWGPSGNCSVSGYTLQAGRSRGSTEAAIPVGHATSVTVDAAGASGIWYVRVVGFIPGFDTQITSNEVRVVVP